MHKLIPFGSLTALVLGVFVAMTVAGAFDDDNPRASNEGVSAVCAEGFDDCNDTLVVDGSDGADDEDGLPVASRDDLTQTCLAGTADCQDTPLEDVADLDPLLPADGGSTGSDRTDEEDLAIEAAFAELEVMDGPPSAEVDVSGVESVTWNDACLGVDTPGIACAQVITPGFIVFLSGAAGDYEFHTDSNGHAVFVAND